MKFRQQRYQRLRTCCSQPFHLNSLFKKSFASSRGCAGGNPHAGHPQLSSVPQKHCTNPCCLPTWETTETQNPISLKPCSGSHTASLSLTSSVLHTLANSWRNKTSSLNNIPAYFVSQWERKKEHMAPATSEHLWRCSPTPTSVPNPLPTLLWMSEHFAAGNVRKNKK